MGKHQLVTCDVVKEHVLLEIQKELKCGLDMVVNLQNRKDAGMPALNPMSKVAKCAEHDGAEMKSEEEIEEEQKSEQQTCNMCSALMLMMDSC